MIPSYLLEYNFLIILVGCVLLSAVLGMVGTFCVLRKEALVGDAVAHSSFPGIVAAFLFMRTRSPEILLLGAFIAGSLSYATIHILESRTRMRLDAILAIVLSGFFGLGMVLKTFLQGNPAYSSSRSAGLQSYILGQAAYMRAGDVRMIIYACIISLVILVLFYKEWKCFIFEEEYAERIGFRRELLHALMLIMTMGLLAVGLKAVGALLIASLLVLPSISALSYAKTLTGTLILSAIFGAAASFIGCVLSAMYEGLSTGAVIVFLLALLSIYSLFRGKRRRMA